LTTTKKKKKANELLEFELNEFQKEKVNSLMEKINNSSDNSFNNNKNELKILNEKLDKMIEENIEIKSEIKDHIFEKKEIQKEISELREKLGNAEKKKDNDENIEILKRCLREEKNKRIDFEKQFIRQRTENSKLENVIKNLKNILKSQITEEMKIAKNLEKKLELMEIEERKI
jgi:hypothetical protein